MTDERDGVAAGPGGAGPGGQDDCSSAPSADSPAQPAPDARSSLPLTAGEEQLQIGDIDLLSVNRALTEIGTHGSVALDALSAPDTISLLLGIQNLSSALAAVQARTVVHLESAIKDDCTAREESPAKAARIARSEASRALRRAPSTAGQTMATCRRLVRSMPGILTSLSQGRVNAEVAHRVSKATATAEPELRTQVDAVLTEHVGNLEDCGQREWAEETQRVMHTLDPDGAEKRHIRASKNRSLTVRNDDDGMCRLSAKLPALEGARIRKGLSLAAEKARAEGDRRGHQQIMADLMADTLLGRGDGVDPTTLDIGVIITDRSLFAPGHADAATIEGYGPVPFEHIRDEMRNAMTGEDDAELALTLRRLYTDPDSGELVAVESRSRAFPPALSRFIRWSHQTCRAPHCNADIRQNDHIIPHAEGGPTSLANANGLCAGDNQKEKAGETVRVITDSDGSRRTVEWTTRYGQKARRGATNLDPVGTAAHRRRRSPLPADQTGEDEEPELHGIFHRSLDRAARHALSTRNPRSQFFTQPHCRHWHFRAHTNYILDPAATVSSEALADLLESRGAPGPADTAQSADVRKPGDEPEAVD
ncbi:DUF222 domain-containing protein [Brachybacterium sp. GCM10030252]|uniref:DUF222 domain-containing protein n=1 Tax=Brachybacterium sp. GCM10030252 TaxID=3273380 RepID=UPI00361B1ABD